MTTWLKQSAKQHKYLLQALVSLGFLVVLIWRSNVSELVGHLSTAPLPYLIPWTVGYTLLSVFAWGNRVFLLFRRLGIGGYWRVVATGYKLQVLATVIPGQLGDLGLVYFLKDLYTPKQSAAVLLMDKLITLFVTLLVAAVGLGVMFSGYYSAILVIVITAGLGLFLWALKQPSQGTGRWNRYRLPGQLAGRFGAFHSEIAAIAADTRRITINLVLTLFQVALAGVSLTLILSWFGVRVALWYVILVQAIAQLAAIIPVTIMGIGLQEAVNVGLLGQAGVEAEVVLAAALSTRAIHLVFMLVMFFIWTRKAFRLADNSSRRRGRRSDRGT